MRAIKELWQYLVCWLVCNGYKIRIGDRVTWNVRSPKEYGYAVFKGRLTNLEMEYYSWNTKNVFLRGEGDDGYLYWAYLTDITHLRRLD